jgi:hypothetical protein
MLVAASKKVFNHYKKCNLELQLCFVPTILSKILVNITGKLSLKGGYNISTKARKTDQFVAEQGVEGGTKWAIVFPCCCCLCLNYSVSC